MSTKDAVLEKLRSAGDTVSGQQLAEELGVSRNAVWKAIQALREDGCAVESCTNKGYRLVTEARPLSAAAVEDLLTVPDCTVLYYPQTDSTNIRAQQLAAAGEPAGVIVIAGSQTAGRGRMGRSFYSPDGTGLYLSILLRPNAGAEEATRITTCAAVAAAEAVEQLSGEPAGIKWVNDVFMRGKKICGILTEGHFDIETNLVDYAVLGIGFNVRTPAGGFPEAIKDIAGPVFADPDAPDRRAELAAAFINAFFAVYNDRNGEQCFEAYRSRLTVLDKDIDLYAAGQHKGRAHVLGLNRDYSLHLRMEDGSLTDLRTGEVSIRPGR